MDFPGGLGGLGFSVSTRILTSGYLELNTDLDSDDLGGIDSDSDEEEHPLLVAVKSKNISGVKHLLSIHLDVNICDSKGWTPLHYSARVGHLESLKCLLEAGARTDSQNRHYETPVYIAAWQGKYKCLKELINQLREEGRSRLEEVINIQAKNKKTALMVAAQHGHTACVELLLENGANPELATKNYMTALHLAIQGDYAECLELIASRMDLKPFIESCHPDSLAHKENAECTMLSPMFIAIQWRSYTCLKMLLSLGFSPDSIHERTISPTPFVSLDEYEHYETAVAFAVQKEDKQALSILFDSGATCDNNYVGTCHPLVKALELPRTEMLDILLERNDTSRFIRHFFKQSSMLLSSISKPYFARNLLLYGCDARLSFEMETTRTVSVLAPYMISDHKKLVEKMELFLQFSIVDSTCQKACNGIIMRERTKAEFSEDLWQNIIITISQPSLLKHICRMKIRHHLYSMYGPSFVKRLHSMPVPQLLKAYLSFDIISPR